MDRIFQNDHGVVNELANAHIISARAIVDTTNRNIIVLWLEDSAGSCWYRIFIDGIYCGIDRYPSCEIDDDLDEGLADVNYGDLFPDIKLCRAYAGTVGDGDLSEIRLSLELENDTFVILSYHNGNGCCSLKSVPI